MNVEWPLLIWRKKKLGQIFKKITINLDQANLRSWLSPMACTTDSIRKLCFSKCLIISCQKVASCMHEYKRNSPSPKKKKKYTHTITRSIDRHSKKKLSSTSSPTEEFINSYASIIKPANDWKINLLMCDSKVIKLLNIKLKHAYIDQNTINSWKMRSSMIYGGHISL